MGWKTLAPQRRRVEPESHKPTRRTYEKASWWLSANLILGRGKIRNPKHEIRNKFKARNLKPLARRSSTFRTFGFRICFGSEERRVGKECRYRWSACH